jgi:hypothetical protein
MMSFARATPVLFRALYVLITVAVASSSALAATATWDRNIETDVAGYRVSYGTQPGIHTVTIDVGNVVSYTFNPPAGARYYVVVQAYNTAGVLSAKSSEVILDVPLANRAPTLTQPANQTSVLDAAVSMPLLAADPDGTPLRFSASGLPPGLTINTTSGLVAGLALAKGSYAVTVTATDGALSVSRSFSWTVTDSLATVVNVSPLDTTLMLSLENTSNANWMATYTSPANRVAMAMLMKFNLTAIPTNAVIHSAVLHMFLTAADAYTAERSYTISLHQVINKNPDIARASGVAANSFTAWTPNACCHASIPMAQGDITPARWLTAVDRAVGFKTWDAAAAVRSWVAVPSGNFGLLLNADTTRDVDRFRVFASAQETNTAARPFLRVTYTVPAASTPAPPPQIYKRVSGDFDGDGRPDLATYRVQDGEWRVWTAASNFTAHTVTSLGLAGDIPVVADYDGDGRSDAAVYRPSNGNWYLSLSRTSEVLVKHWGTSTDTPLALDHDGDGKADLALLRATGSEILLSGSNYSASVKIR